MDARQQRGLTIAALCKITRKGNEYVVPSQTGNGSYTVCPDPESPTCTCPDHELHRGRCKHIFAVEFYVKREQHADGSETVVQAVTVTETKRPTYKQDWPAYNAAQTNEKAKFLCLLCDLCAGIEEAPQKGRGQRRIPARDAIFAACYKVYSTFSGRRFMTDLRDAKDKGFIGQVPHYNSIFNCLENPEVTPILTAMIVESSRPLAAVEVDFACDSSGFSTNRWVRWFDHKHGKPRQEHHWVKVHLTCGVKTNIVTAVVIKDKDANDNPQLAEMLDKTRENFTVRDWCADKGYTSYENLERVEAAGGTPFIAFKKNAHGGHGGTWAKMFHYFSFKRDEFLAHYHKRSNVESTFSAIKRLLGDGLRSKSDTAMVNEALAKILCFNITCLIHEMYELGIEPVFWQGAAGKT